MVIKIVLQCDVCDVMWYMGWKPPPHLFMLDHCTFYTLFYNVIHPLHSSLTSIDGCTTFLGAVYQPVYIFLHFYKKVKKNV